jgi:two-component system, NtrC family, sensor kinase
MSTGPIDTKKYTSLRKLFVRWLVLSSVIPLVLIAFFFLSRFKSAVQDEMFQRLLVYARQTQTVLNDYELFLKNKVTAVCEDKIVGYNWKTANIEELESALDRFFEEDLSMGVTLYDSSGTPLVRTGSRDEAIGWGAPLSANIIEKFTGTEILPRAFYQQIGNDVFLVLSVIRQAQDEAVGWTGYAEFFILLSPESAMQIQKEQKLDIIFFGPAGEVFISSLPGEKFSKKQLSQDFLRGNNHFFDISVRGQTYGFISTAISWGEQKFLVAIGASKASLSSGLQQLMYFVFGAVVILLVCLLAFSYFFTKQIIVPIARLVDGVQTMRDTAEPVYVQATVDNEIGLLTDRFNEMSVKMHQYRDDLENQLSNLESANKEINDTQTQLVQSAKLAGLGQLVAGVAHELNNPIGFVYSNIQHLREYVTALTDLIEEMGKNNTKYESLKTKYDYNFISKDLPKLITSVEEGAKRTRDIVTGLRNFSRASDKENKKFSIVDCIDSTLELLEGTQKKESIQVTKRVDSFVPLIEGNPNQMSQVFMNLLSNAYQAISAGGNVHIDVSFQESENRLQIKVKDSGAGITPENLAKIFDPFFTTKDVGQGTGLGLSISYGIIKSHGGDIQVESDLGQGTEFTIFLPAAPAGLSSV